jgi:hypothetical protein
MFRIFAARYAIKINLFDGVSRTVTFFLHLRNSLIFLPPVTTHPGPNTTKYQPLTMDIPKVIGHTFPHLTRAPRLDHFKLHTWRLMKHSKQYGVGGWQPEHHVLICLRLASLPAMHNLFSLGPPHQPLEFCWSTPYRGRPSLWRPFSPRTCAAQRACDLEPASQHSSSQSTTSPRHSARPERPHRPSPLSWPGPAGCASPGSSSELSALLAEGEVPAVPESLPAPGL